MRETISEILWIVKGCLTTLWFWLPILYAGYLLLQFWMVFYIHPLSVFVLPAILALYAVKQETKRTKAQYGLTETKILRASHALGIGPEQPHTWEIEKSVEEYRRMLSKKQLEEE